MTYNIDYVGGPSGWLFVILVILMIAACIAGAVIAFPEDKRRRSRKRSVIGAVIAATLVVASVEAIVAIEHARAGARDERSKAVQAAWGLEASDANYLLEDAYAPSSDCFFTCSSDYKPSGALITLDGEPVRGYLLKQGDSLRLIVKDKPVAVVSR